jgi:hypothetical protein
MTTPIDPFERRLPAALTDLAQPRTPDYMIDILGTTAGTRQRHAWRSSGAWGQVPSRLGRLAAAGAIVVIVAFAGASLMTTAPSTGPLATSSPAAVRPVPDRLVGDWTGDPRTVASPDGSHSVVLISFNTMAVLVTRETGEVVLWRVAPTDDGSIVLSSDSTEAWCTRGSLGRYAWAVSADGNELTLTATEDPCAARGAALAGTWFRRPSAGAPCFHCLGEIAAGRHASVSFDPGGRTMATGFGHLTYTVPTGWTNTIDSPVTFGLAPPTAISGPAPTDPNAPRDGILVLGHIGAVDPVTCGSVYDETVTASSATLMAYIVRSSRIQATTPQPATIAGAAGSWVDLEESSSRPACGADPERDADVLLYSSEGPLSGHLSLATHDRIRLFLLDVEGRGVVAVAITSTDPERFDAVVSMALPIIESFTIH